MAQKSVVAKFGVACGASNGAGLTQQKAVVELAPDTVADVVTEDSTRCGGCYDSKNIETMAAGISLDLCCHCGPARLCITCQTPRNGSGLVMNRR
jgi:L-alanine-DL-glutamate epimerase-like enolase superfamily enzyme